MVRPLGTFKYKLNEGAFDQLTDETLYWLGYVAGDGSIKTRVEGQHQLSIVSKDIDILEKFKVFVGTNRPLHAGHGTHEVRLSSQRIVDRLATFGITNKKSLNIRILNGVNTCLAFWQGYFDANGYAAVYLIRGQYRPQMSISSGSPELCKQFVEFWLERGYEFRTRLKGKHGYESCLAGKKVVRLLADYFIHRPENARMKRKHDNIVSIVSEYGEWAGVTP
jgi:hypothetical protein